MYWKNVKNKFSIKKSIANQLTLLYTVATVSIFIIVSLLLYWLLVDIVSTAEKQFLTDEVYIMQHLFKQKPFKLDAVKEEVDGMPPEIMKASYRYYIKIVDNKQKIIMQTPKMQDVLAEAEFPDRDLENWSTKIQQWYSPIGTRFLLITGPAEYDKKGNPTKYVQVAIDVTYQDKLTKEFRDKIFLALIICIFLVFILGKIIAHKGLRSLYNMIEATEKITANNLSQRVDIKSWPIELTSLGMAYNRMLDRIEIAYEQLTQCINELAHEFRTPINNLMGEAGLALSRPRPSAEYIKVLESNLEEYDRLSKLVDNILFIARAENPQTTINKDKLNLEKELNKICEYYNIMAAEKNITINLKLAVTSLEAEPILFQRAINNLLANAIQYSPQNSYIEIRSELTAADEVKIGVVDTGIGIPHEHLHYIFERFYRVDQKYKQSIKGIGLGLAIVKSIMELHKGRITAISTPGKGTTIALCFPQTNN